MLGSSFPYKGTSNILGLYCHDLINTLKNHFQTLTLEIRFQNYECWKDANIQSITDTNWEVKVFILAF